MAIVEQSSLSVKAISGIYAFCLQCAIRDREFYMVSHQLYMDFMYINQTSGLTQYELPDSSVMLQIFNFF